MNPPGKTPSESLGKNELKTLSSRLIVNYRIFTLMLNNFYKENIAFLKTKLINKVFGNCYGKLIVVPDLSALKLNNFRHTRHHFKLSKLSYKNTISVFKRKIYKLLETLVTTEKWGLGKCR